MIIGDCPYEGCNGRHMIPCAEDCPSFSIEICESCGKEFWLLHSRINPVAYTYEGFMEEYEVNEETKQIIKK